MTSIIVLLLSLTITSCSLLSDKVSQIGQQPKLSKIAVYETDAPSHNLSMGRNDGFYDNRSLFMRGAESKPRKYSNSIWSEASSVSSRKIGDIISVNIAIKDQAKLDNQTQKSRSGKTSMGMPRLFGLQSKVSKMLDDSNGADSLIDMKSNNASNGSGKINRSERIQAVIAATVVSILPSGNLIIKGSQEVRVNYEAREVTIEGIVNPMDIDNKNIVKLEKIAEARISYGGKGHISEYQQDPYGKQLVDIVSPF